MCLCYSSLQTDNGLQEDPISTTVSPTVSPPAPLAPTVSPKRAPHPLAVSASIVAEAHPSQRLFNLQDERWISVTTGDAHPNPDTVERVSLREALLGGRLYRGLASPDAGVRASTLRLMLGVLHRSSRGPTSADQAAGWAEHGFPAELITAYLDAHHGRFWLIDDDAPFMQVAGLERWGQAGQKVGPPKDFIDSWQVMSPRVSMGNTNPVFNPNQRGKAGFVPAPLSFGDAAGILIAHQTFASGGLDKRLLTSATSAPVFSAALVNAVGETLQETLALNLRLYPAELADRDTASWELPPISAEALIDQLIVNTGRPLQGPVDRYSFISRGVRLLAIPGPDGPVVQHVAYAGCQLRQGEGFGQGNEVDPMVTLRPTKVPKQAPGLTSFKASMDRTLWSQLDLILPDHLTKIVFTHDRQKIGVAGQEAGVMLSARALLLARRDRQQDALNAARLPAAVDEDDDLDDDLEAGYASAAPAPAPLPPLSVQLVAMLFNNTKILDVRAEELSLPGRLVEDPELVKGQLHQLLRLATHAQRQLDQAGQVLMRALQRHGSTSMNPAENLKPLDPDTKKLVARYADQLPGMQHFWGLLQPHFGPTLALLGSGTDADVRWRQALLTALRTAWAENEGSVGSGDWAFRACALGSASLRPLLAVLNVQIRELQEDRPLTVIFGLGSEETGEEDRPDAPAEGSDPAEENE